MSDPYLHRPDLQAARERRHRYDATAHSAAREALQKRAAVIRERVPIKDVVERVVKLKKAGRAFVGQCPFHADGTASLAVYPRPGDRVPVPFWVCYGCQLKGDVIKFVMERQKLDWRGAIELLESENGLRHLKEAAPPAPAKATQVYDRKKLERAHRIWNRSLALEPGGVVDLYLRARALVPPADYGVGDGAVNAGWPTDLRFEPRCWHDLEEKELPAMVAAIRGYDNTLLTVHRTYLAQRADGAWGKAPVDKAKLVVGVYGPGFIRLGPDADEMLGGEGIETSLSAMQLWKRSGLAFVTSGRMKSVEPPFACADFIYAADKGAKAGKKPWGEIFAHDGAKADFNIGRKVSVQIPNIAAPKADFNDLVLARARGDYVAAPRQAAVDKRPPAEPRRALPPPRQPPKPIPARRDGKADDVVGRLDEVGRGERAAHQRYISAKEALSTIDRRNEDALAVARAELREANEIWQRALKGQRVMA